jgi:hypothetical protein
MTQPEDNQTPLNAPASGATPAAPSGQSADSKTSGKQPAGSIEAQRPSQDLAQKPTQGDAPVPAPAATPPVKQDVDSLKQAAQLAHKPSTDGVANPTGSNDCALAGGDSPQTPQPISKSKSAKKSRSKKRDNHVSIRLTDEEWDVIERLMALTGLTLSEAIRAIISAFESKTGSVHLRPKSPPAHLEKLLGELSRWRKEFSKAKPRLNIPTPVSDKERHAEVTKWRAEADRLLKVIPQMEELVRLALGVMTSLTTERVIQITKGYTTLGGWKANFEEKNSPATVAFLQALMDLLADAGIKPQQK